MPRRLFPCCRPQQTGPPPQKSARVTRADLCVKWPSERIPAKAITSVPRRPARKALFVSRLHPDTTVPDVLGLVNSFVTDESACARV
ncbi:hypothetical protein HPB48_007982 [Haemaphysalis longicornis]|uniref:Uncharacterized protein n=1 Tax=Haemaphysalis longicornis TaxID=44386 RepID=A0A9J6GNI0_HAELO|nr:hypothetical protein HPB48_007982 [Haemaphysalis longicornis]